MMQAPEMVSREQATAAANVAADRAGLKIIELHDMPKIDQAAELLNEVWSMSREQPLIASNTLRALSHSGNYVCGAYDGDRMVGAIVGFLGKLDGADQLHSHVLGVSPRVQSRNIGFALKQHQRAWAIDHGIDIVTWTFDPLVRRNAFFNVTKLGATINAYYPDFYGNMNDGINDGDRSDRVMIHWPLHEAGVVSASEGRSNEPDLRQLQESGAVVVLRPNEDGTPQITEDSAPVLLASIPEDIVDLRRRDRDLADRWRLALRDTFGAALTDRYATAGMTRSGWYVLRRGDA